MKEIKKYQNLEHIPQGKASTIIQPGCLVIEGGAFRGLYNQGVLDALMLNDINIHTVIGVSAGALAGMNYVSGQIGRSARANLEYRHDSRFVGVKAMHHAHSILDLDFLLETYNEYDPLDLERFESDDRHFVAVATNCLTGKAMYYDKNNCSNIYDAIKASASMPYISSMVEVDGIPCLDGGCSCHIAYQWALDQGFEKIVVIRTRERGYRKDDKNHSLAPKIYKEYEAFAHTLLLSDANYNWECQQVEDLQDKGRIFVIAPKEPVNVSRIEGDMEKLGELYWEGFEDAMHLMEKLRAYLE